MIHITVDLRHFLKKRGALPCIKDLSEFRELKNKNIKISNTVCDDRKVELLIGIDLIRKIVNN